MTEGKSPNNPLLTTPPPILEHRPFYLTGNEYLSLPQIGPAGEFHSINALHLGARGLLEFSGGEESPLLAPFLLVDGRKVNLAEIASWSYNLDWLPRFEGRTAEGLFITGETALPPGRRGGCCCITLVNRSRYARRVRAGWQGCWSGFNHIIFNRREIKGERSIVFNEWTKSLILEARSGLPLAALALALDPRMQWLLNEAEPGSFSSALEIDLEPDQSTRLTLFFAVNLEGDGAGTTAVDLMRRGAASLIRETAAWLEQHRLTPPQKDLEQVLNRNLFFNYFYALGRALDTDGLVPVTSRSPRYYVSAAFWSRDTLLWSFPGLLLVDTAIARELLLAVFERHLARPGEHAHYINGVVLYPGFELDQLAAYLLALERYELSTGDCSLLDEARVRRGLEMLVTKADEQYDPLTELYRTFLDPSDDPVPYPFLVYDNALLQRGFAYLGSLQAAGRWRHDHDFNARSEALRKSIYRHGTVKGPCGPMFAWAVDGAGRFQLYDNPPGSLQLLSFYRFCSPQDTIYKNTVAWIRSANNAYFHQNCAFEEAGSLHCGNPWPLAAANDLLALGAGGADFLKEAPMDNGFCCETVDPHSGRVSTGAAFASAAGFLAYALWHARSKTQEQGSKKDE
ncbi:MAG: glycoside hydrolase family 125 protein [Bacillota bacterium]